jgi:hypothetical protein
LRKLNILFALFFSTTLSSFVSAEEPIKRFEIGASASLLVMGTDRPTGGFMPSVSIGHRWPINDTWSVALGGQGGVFGIGGDSHWIGFIAGPYTNIGVKPWSTNITLGLTATAGFGRIPTCNAWDYVCNMLDFSLLLPQD